MPRRWEPTGRTLSSWYGLVACFEWGAPLQLMRGALCSTRYQWLAAPNGWLRF
jgi:hypothetical protein